MKETLGIVNDKSVKSSLGWSVEIVSDDFLEYSEEGRAIKLEIEECRNGASRQEWIIYWPAAWTWNGRQDESIAQGKRYEILDRIELAFWKLGMTLREIL